MLMQMHLTNLPCNARATTYYTNLHATPKGINKNHFRPAAAAAAAAMVLPTTAATGPCSNNSTAC